MYFWYLIIIMVASGVIGGVIYYHTDSNTLPESNPPIKIRKVRVCMLFGIGATLMVPFFLKLADSKLLDTVYLDEKEIQSKPKDSATVSYFAIYFKQNPSDSIISDTVPKPSKQSKVSKGSNDDYVPIKKGGIYALWIAYCTVAASAGIRFIELLVSKLLTEAQINRLIARNKALQQQVDSLGASDRKPN